jgi:hypothetical protein
MANAVISNCVIEFFQNLTHQLKVVNTGNQIKPQPKALRPVSILIRNDFETFKPTHDVLVQYPLTGDGLVCSPFFLCQLSFPGLFLG